MSFMERLEAIVGPDYVTDKPDICETYAYGCFLGSQWKVMPDYVVMPQTTEQVSQVVKLANEFDIPITPKGMTSGSGHSGAITGGIVLDLMYMNKILKIDPVGMKTIAEAGCSYFKLNYEIFKQDMMLPITEFSPGPSVAGAGLLPACCFGSVKHGRPADLIEGLEVVLPTGEIVRMGSMAYADSEFGPYYRYVHGPDLIGLYVISNGSMGIVTKVAFGCLHRPPHWDSRAYYWPEEEIQAMTDVMTEVTQKGIFHVQLNDKWKYVSADDLNNPTSALPDDAYFILSFFLNGETEDHLNAEIKMVDEICERQGGKRIKGITETFFDEWPTYFTMATNPLMVQTVDVAYKLGKSQYWYIYDSINYPITKFPEVYAKLKEFGQKYGIWGFPKMSILDAFVMRGQAICSQEWAFANSRDPKDVEAIFNVRDDFRKWFGAQGGTHEQHFPPITPPYAWENQMSAHDLAEKIKKALDPNAILSPGTFTSGKRVK